MKNFLTIMITFITCFCMELYIDNVQAAEIGNNNVSLTTNYSFAKTIENDDFDTNCADFAGGLKIIGILILIAKILVPLIIIIKASINFINIVVKGDNSEFKKQINKLAFSIVAGIIIFFIPKIVNIIFGFITDYNSPSSDIKICRECLFDPYGNTCSNSIK